MKKPAITGVCVIYVGRTEGESSQWGKVGRVKGEWRLEGRTKEYKVADRDFWFVCRAAFQVSLPAGKKPHAFERSVQDELEMRGLKRRGEQFLPPESSMELLVREVEDVIKKKDVVYQALDVSALRGCSRLIRQHRIDGPGWRSRPLEPRPWNSPGSARSPC